jgi:hypothetical protein
MQSDTGVPTPLSPLIHTSGHGDVTIAGVPLRPISDEPPWLSLEDMRRERASARRAQEAGIDAREARGEEDRRSVSLTLGGVDPARPDGGPAYTFLVTDALFDAIAKTTEAKGRPLSQDELLPLALESVDGAVGFEFSPGAINAINASFYAAPMAFSDEAAVAEIFAGNKPLNTTLGALLADRAGKPETLRIKEICSGNRTGHWRWAAAGAFTQGVQRIELVLSDFVQPSVPADLPTDRLGVSAETYSLLDSFPVLEPDKRFDAMITTYGFDSVWLPDDLRLCRIGDNWYQSLYRLKVDDWNPRQAELVTALIAGEPLANATVQDYEGIFIEEVQVPFDVAAHKYSKYIQALPPNEIMNFPGGLIKRVAEAFDTQLAGHGVFVSADTANFGSLNFYPEAARVTGLAARYKMEHYVMAKTILEKEHGLTVEFADFASLAETYLPKGWQADASDQDLAGVQTHADGTTMAMIVRRAAKEES